MVERAAFWFLLSVLAMYMLHLDAIAFGIASLLVFIVLEVCYEMDDAAQRELEQLIDTFRRRK